jgi:hypothetical protein
MAAKTEICCSLLPKMQCPDIAMRLMAPAAISILNWFMDLKLLQICLNLLLMAFIATAAGKPGLFSLRLNTG